jgi:hypothetical protein
LAPLITGELQWHKSTIEDPFVVVSNIQARPNTTYGHQRCQRDYAMLYAWLKENGIVERNPLHTLRKEFGTQICRTHGLYVASRALCHSSYAVTEMHYVDKTAPVVPDFF